MIAYLIWDRIHCVWRHVVTSLTVWRSIPRAVGTLVCRGVPLALLGLPPGATAPSVPYTPAAGPPPSSAAAPAPYVPAIGVPPLASLAPALPAPAVGPLAFAPGESLAPPSAPTVGMGQPSPFTPVVPPPVATVTPPMNEMPGPPTLPPESTVPTPPPLTTEVPEPSFAFMGALFLLALLRPFRRG